MCLRVMTMTSDNGLCTPASAVMLWPGSDMYHVMAMLRTDLMGSLTGPHICYTRRSFTSSLQAVSKAKVGVRKIRCQQWSLPPQLQAQYCIADEQGSQHKSTETPTRAVSAGSMLVSLAARM